MRQKKQIRVVVCSKPVHMLDNQAVVLFLFENRSFIGEQAGLIDRHLNGVISQSIKEEKITGAYGESVLVASEGRIMAPKILVLGLGEASSLIYERLSKAATTVFHTLMRIQVFNFAAFLPVIDVYNYDFSRIVELFFDGIVSGLISVGYTPETTLTMVDEGKKEKEIIAGLNRVRSAYIDRVKVLIVKGESDPK